MMSCKIEKLGKYRNGSFKYWCAVHKSIVNANEEGISPVCEKAHLPEVKEEEKLYLDPKDWKGGIGLWGALRPIYTTTSLPIHDEGIHVHARNTDDGVKDIDATYKQVYIKTPSKDLFNTIEYIKLDSEIATAYTTSMVTGKVMKCIHCSHCGEPHIDSDYFAVTYHRKHLCTYCGKQFWDETEGISNPVISIKKIFEGQFERQSIVLVDRELNIKQRDYPGGIEIWGSNPAIIWTRGKREEAGIHVHVYENNNTGERIHDETYGKVVIDDIELSESQVRYLMIQNSLPHLKGKVLAFSCTKCHKYHFDRLDSSIRPHQHHLCEYCGNEFQTTISCVGNPLIYILEKLTANYQELQKK